MRDGVTRDGGVKLVQVEREYRVYDGHAVQRGPLGTVGQPAEFAGAQVATGLPLFMEGKK